jgi:serine/threonine-protein kinase
VETDRNLLFGVLALQADILDPQQFAAACSEWAGRKGTSLADLLIQRGWLTPEDRAHVEYLLQRKLKRHGGDDRASLADVITPGVRQILGDIPAADVQQSLADLPAAPGAPLPSTVAYEPGLRQRYTLTRLHAQGGIGQVWLAHDQDLGRDVALKELRPDRGGSPAAVARFLEEAKVTGQLEHPGVVPVYELVQPPDGRPCYAMRFVGGRTLADAIREYHRQRQAGQAGALGLRELLTAFVGVCKTVAYAHSRGVLHRDLKPANVALGDYGEVVVLDWGLAKVLGRAEEPAGLLPVALGPADEAGRTQQGQVLGTPAYMAPEQARGRLDLLDPRSDVYGLGAVLYEVLTGEPPFSGADTPAVLQRVLQEPAVPPRQRVPAAPAALAAVCLKALAKRPEDRYPSAGELAQDVERWLADEPVSAWREPLGVRVGRWVRRHRSAVAALAVVLLAAVGGLSAGVWLLDRTNQRIDAERRRADENFRQARQAVDDYHTAVSENVLLNSGVPGIQPLRKELLGRALAYYQAFAAHHGDDPALRRDLARAYYRMGVISKDLGKTGEGLAHLQEGRRLYEELLGPAPHDTDLQAELARAERHAATLLYITGEKDEAVRVCRSALGRCEEVLQASPGSLDKRADLAWCHNNLAFLYEFTGHGDLAAPQYTQALRQWRDLAVAAPEQPLYTNNLLRTATNVASTHVRTGQFRGAVGELEELVPLGERLAQEHPEVADFVGTSALTQWTLGRLARTSGDRERAGPALRQAAETLEKLTETQPSLAMPRQMLASTYALQGEDFLDGGRDKEARVAFEKALAVAKKPASDDAKSMYAQIPLAEAQRGMGRWLVRQGRREEAGTHLEGAATTFERFGEGDWEYQYALAQTRALQSQCAGEPGRQRGYVEQALGHLREAVAAGWRNRAWTERDPALVPLHVRAEFQKLLAEMDPREKP